MNNLYISSQAGAQALNQKGLFCNTSMGVRCYRGTKRKPKFITKLHNSSFIGQNLIAKLNHFALYLSLLAITTSGILKKLFNGETLNFFLFKLKFKTNFDLADKFYDLHIISNYTLIVLISLHIFAVLFHKIFLKENILKRMT